MTVHPRQGFAADGHTGARVALVVVIATLSASSVAAQNETAQRPGQPGCLQALLASPAVDSVLATVSDTTSVIGTRFCQTVAVMAVTNRTDGMFAVLQNTEMSARDVQSTRSLGPSGSGSLAQGSAVPASTPTAIAGASIAAVGSDAGSDAIASIALNPAVFFIDPSVREQVARFTRFADLSVLVPVNGIDQNEDGRIDYFGVRVRINVNGLSAGARLMRDAERIFGSIVEQDAQFALRIRNALESASPANAKACATALLSSVADEEAVRTCGGSFELAFDPALHNQLAEQLRRAREEADSRYLGLDLRLDTGDPTFGAVPNASGTTLFAGLAAGRNVPYSRDGLSSGGVNARVGVRYNTLSDTSATNFAVDGGIGLEWRRAMESQHITASLGIEFRYGGDTTLENAMQTNYTLFRAALKVPVTTANAVVLSYSTPIAGNVSRSLSVAFDLGLLFGGQ